MKTKLLFTWCLCLLSISCLPVDKKDRYDAIYSGAAWFDQNNNEVNAHGACIVKEGGKYYLFGEYKSDTTNAFTGFSCYSSVDLKNWQFEKLVLSVQEDGLLGPERVGERVKVMKCPMTGEYVMYMHTDDMKYMDPHVGYATCSSINGDYKFQGELLHEGKYIRKWDLGTFQDHDGKGYLLTHEGFIYELADDYKSVVRIVVSDEAPGGESPAMFRKDGTYFWLFSNKTSWERNDNYYLTATSLEGPWNRKGNFAPEGTLTWNSQCSFVLPITTRSDTLYMYMGDRWSFPKQGSAATQVWQPITVRGDEMSIPEFYDNWSFDENGIWSAASLNLKSIKKETHKQGNWDTANDQFKSNDKGALITIPFTGEQVAIRGVTNNTSGYARVVLKNSRKEEVVNTIVDFYTKNEGITQNFVSPILELDKYILSIEVMGEHPAWSDKRKSDYGSTDNYIVIQDVLIR
ncbi:MAG: family 43 glycosylhydrolase [Tannerella sp.]|jgi:hypothetical protein|nr:family 43 glycosylhydrolase [Tannerella sp.]